MPTAYRLGIWINGSYNTISSNEIKNMFSSCVYISAGEHNLVTLNDIHDLRSCDVFRSWGRYNTFSYNEAYDGLYFAGEEHPDCFQVFSNGATDEARDILFEGNYWHDLDAQVVYMSNAHSSPYISDFTFRNNIWANISMQAQIPNIPRIKFYNNVFYKCAQGTYDAHAVDIQTGSNDSEVRNNIFLECSNNPADPVKGWYSFGGTGCIGSHNYVGGTSFAAKTHSETGLLNGGDPHFVSLSVGALDFHLQGDSILKDVGTTIASFSTDKDSGARPVGVAWDIGPYEYGSGASPWAMIFG